MVGELGFWILLTAPSWGLRPDLGGVDGLTGRGRLFLLEKEESRLRGEGREVSEEVEFGEKKVAAAPAGLQTGGSELDTSKGAANVAGLVRGLSDHFCSALSSACISTSDSMK